MKRLVSLLLVLAMVFALCACGGAKKEEAPAAEAPAAEAPAAAPAEEAKEEAVDYGEEVTLMLSHIRPEGSPADIAVKAFAEEVTEATGGTVKFDIYPASQLGDYTTVMEMVMVGDVDIQVSTVSTSVDKFFGIANAAYIASTWAEAKEKFATGSALSEVYMEKMTDYGLKYLCMYPLYFGGIAVGVEPTDPTNPDAKSGIKIRVPSMVSFEKTAEAFGFLGTPLPSSETFTAWQTGVVEGAIGMGAEGYFSNMADLVKYYLPINDHFECWHAYMNLEKFESLSELQQEAIMTAAANMEANRWEVAEAETAEYEQKLRDKGAVVVEFTDEQLQAFGAKAQTEVWPHVAPEVGEDYFAMVTGQ